MAISIETLKEVEAGLPALLRAETLEWHSLDVDYYPPRVERVWTQVSRSERLMLHVIHPCAEGKALFHPHPWPSAVRTFGTYEMRSGSGEPLGPPPHVTLRQVLTPGTYYEMTDSRGWHSVRPLSERPAPSVMLIGSPWFIAESAHIHLPPLSDARTVEILRLFRALYPR